MYLSKSDFKTARDCPAKLYYKKNRYPSTLSENAYLRYLAEGGFMVEKAAQLLFPDGKEFEFALGETEAAAEATRAFMLGAEDSVRFEAVVTWENRMARIDILEKRGRTFRLIEVKSISVDTSADEPLFRGKQGGILSKRLPYLEDVTFQTLLLRQAYPDFEIVPFLCVVDKAAVVSEDATLGCFELTEECAGSGFSRPFVRYKGNVEALRANPPVVFLNVSEEVAELTAEVQAAADRFAESLRGETPVRLPGTLGPRCAKCEYRYHPVSALKPGVKDGFYECWGEQALASPHMVDLYHAANYGSAGRNTIESLAKQGKSALTDLNPEHCSGQRGEWQARQILHSRDHSEWTDPALPSILRGHPYPHHFIDFETTRTALPCQAGMHPYKLITFQWSCHTVRAPGAVPEHSEWLCTEAGFPNFEFARSLKAQIGDDGTVYVWSHHESTCMKTIAEQMDQHEERDPGLTAWLLRFEAQNDKRIIDLWKLAQHHYFHPEMKGSVSLKYVLPAVWKNTPALWDDPAFQEYVQLDDSGIPLNPYQTLPDLTLSDNSSVGAIAEGTGAIRAYEDILFGAASKNAERKHAVRNLLLQYCKLDTAAMVMVWRKWATEESI